MPQAVDTLGAPRFANGVAAAGDDWHRAIILDLLPHCLAVIGFVCGNRKRCRRAIQNVSNRLCIVNLSASQDEADGPFAVINERMNFGGATAARTTDRLPRFPPFAPLAARWAFTMVLSIMRNRRRDRVASFSNIFCHTPLLAQRLKRL